MIVHRAALFLTTLLVVAVPARAEEATQRVAVGKHFRVVVHFDSEVAAAQALKAVEALWPHAAKLYGLGTGELDDKLEVNLYRDAGDYGLAMDERAGGKFKRNLACALWDSQSAHVAMQPEVSDDLLAIEGLPYLTLNLLLHEAAHLVRFRAMANYRSHPDWLADGAAQWLKYEALRSLGLIRSLEEDPMSARGIERAQGKRDLDVATILDDGVKDPYWYTVYAVKRVFFTYLMAKHARITREALRAIKRLGGGSGFGTRAKKAFAEALGSSGMRRAERDWPKYLDGLKPQWSESRRSLETAGEDWLQVAFPKTNALAWQTKPVGKKAYSFRARVRFFRNYGKQANILLDRRDGGFVSVALTLGFGVNVFSYDAKKDTWQSRASKELAGLDFDKVYDVRVDVDGARLKVHVGGQVVADVTFTERKGGLTGPWGLGAQAGSAVRWSNVEVR